ncbi:hypothetical protein SAURM35S_09757 [Streptomyces aurantiogriseus]
MPVGLVDKPYEQRRDALWVDFSGAAGHMQILGGPQSGKSTLLRSLICSFALTHTPYEVQFYGLDFGGGGMASVAGLPHVGGVASRLDPERVRRTVAEVYGVMAWDEWEQLKAEAAAGGAPHMQLNQLDPGSGPVRPAPDPGQYGELKASQSDLAKIAW